MGVDGKTGEDRVHWSVGQRVAWTNRDGPGAPPGVPGWAWVASAACIATAIAALLATDALCPDHRRWVQTLSAVAFLSAAAAVVGVVFSWPAVPVLVLVSSMLGMAIGMVDAAHEPVRGTLVVACFAAAMLLGAWMAARDLAARRWARAVRLESDLAPPAMPDRSPAPPQEPATSAPATAGESEEQARARATVDE